MANKLFKFKGEAYYAKVQEGNHDEYGGKEFYKISVALDDESWSKFSKSGLTLKAKELEAADDAKVITFRRDVEAKTGVSKKTGKKFTLGGGPPKVTHEGEAFEGLIGNGSVVEVVVERYPSKIAKFGHRLESITVLDLIPYEPFEEDEDEDDVVETKEEPKKTTTKKKDLPF